MRANHRQRRIRIEYETHGDPAHPPLLLVMGLGMQLIALAAWNLSRRWSARGYSRDPP